jgi:hypothetical protein
MLIFFQKRIIIISPIVNHSTTISKIIQTDDNKGIICIASKLWYQEETNKRAAPCDDIAIILCNIINSIERKKLIKVWKSPQHSLYIIYLSSHNNSGVKLQKKQQPANWSDCSTIFMLFRYCAVVCIRLTNVQACFEILKCSPSHDFLSSVVRISICERKLNKLIINSILCVCVGREYKNPQKTANTQKRVIIASTAFYVHCRT